MVNSNNGHIVALCLVLALGLLCSADGFVPTFVPKSRNRFANHCYGGSCSVNKSPAATRPSALSMSREGESAGILATLGGGLIVALFVATSFFPFIGGKETPMGLADSVVTRQDAPGKLANFESEKYRLSRSAIQEKLNAVPIFYLTNDDGSMKTDLYTSYDDAREAAGSGAVKATTMDQVTYPLLLRRGRMRMAPPPLEVQQAEDALDREGAVVKQFKLFPSKQAMRDAAEMNMDVGTNDIPLFVADRLAFQGSKGPQVPLFLEKADAITSYNRLRESSGASTRLPEAPTIRSTTLLDELRSMEKGTRPGVSQLAFYATADDLLRADALIQ
jgi:hypothetical protein